MDHHHLVDLPPDHPVDPSNPSAYITEGSMAYLKLVVPLYQAAIMGDWESAKSIFDENRYMLQTAFSSRGDKILHMAVTATETKLTINFVDNLVKLLTPQELESKDIETRTAFWIACSLGKLEMAKIMFDKNPELLHMRSGGQHPITIAAKNGKHNTVKWLYDKLVETPSTRIRPWITSAGEKHSTILSCVEGGLYDVALQILNGNQDQQSQLLSIVTQYSYNLLLHPLASNPDAFNIEENNLITRIMKRICRAFGMKVQAATEEESDAMKILQIVWKHATETLSIKDLVDVMKVPDILFAAAEKGNTRVIAEVLRTYPRFIFEKNDVGHTIFHVAVMHRHQGVYNLLYEIAGSTRDMVFQMRDTDKNILLHLVGKTSQQMAAKTCGASLLMQRELLWFQEVNKMTPPYDRDRKNLDGKTAYELFSEENKDLVSRGLDWMKDCMVVATLIVTVAFAVAFTVPGGYNQDHGLPLFTHRRAFLVFVIADAVSLFASSTSLLMFLTILTSGRDQRDFMYSLPTKLMIGILTLFVSVAAMMVTFSASFFVLYHKGLKWVPIFIAVFATVPVIVFGVFQFPLLVDMFRSMCDSRYLFNPKKRVLYPKKPRSHTKKSV